MVFIDRDGRVLVDRAHRPWNLSRIVEIFAGLWFIIVQFFMTLVAPFRRGQNNSERRRSSGNHRSSGWGPGGGGGGGSGGRGNSDGGSGGLRTNRRIGRVVNTSMDCNIPGGG